METLNLLAYRIELEPSSDRPDRIRFVGRLSRWYLGVIQLLLLGAVVFLACLVAARMLLASEGLIFIVIPIVIAWLAACGIRLVLVSQLPRRIEIDREQNRLTLRPALSKSKQISLADIEKILAIPQLALRDSALVRFLIQPREGKPIEIANHELTGKPERIEKQVSDIDRLGEVLSKAFGCPFESQVGEILEPEDGD